MNVQVIKEKETPLLSRKRVTLNAVYEGKTPSRQEILGKVAELLKAEKSLVVIKHIYTKYGLQQAKVIAHVYKTVEDKNNVEEKALLKRHEPKAKKEGEEKAEKPKEAPKKEESKGKGKGE